MVTPGGWARITEATVVGDTGCELVVTAPSTTGAPLKLFVPYRRIDPTGPVSPASPRGTTGILVVEKRWAEGTGVAFS